MIILGLTWLGRINSYQEQLEILHFNYYMLFGHTETYTDMTIGHTKSNKTMTNVHI